MTVVAKEFNRFSLVRPINEVMESADFSEVCSDVYFPISGKVCARLEKKLYVQDLT